MEFVFAFNNSLYNTEKFTKILYTDLGQTVINNIIGKKLFRQLQSTGLLQNINLFAKNLLKKMRCYVKLRR